MSIDNDAVKVIAKTVISTVKKLLKSAKFDRTFKGRVTAMLGNNKYIITINGKEHTAMCPYTLGFHETVYVTALENDFNRLLVEPVDKKIREYFTSDSLVNNTAVNDSTKPVSSAVTHLLNAQIAYLNNTNINHHPRFDLTNGTIADAVTIKMNQGFFGGEISIVGFNPTPSDTYNGNSWGTVKWTKGSGTIAFLQFIIDRTPELVTRSICLAESLDTGWVSR